MEGRDLYTTLCSARARWDAIVNGSLITTLLIFMEAALLLASALHAVPKWAPIIVGSATLLWIAITPFWAVLTLAHSERVGRIGAEQLLIDQRPKLSGFITFIIDHGEVAANPPARVHDLGFKASDIVKSYVVVCHIQNQGGPTIARFSRASATATDGLPLRCVVAPFQNTWHPFPDMPLLTVHEAEVTSLQKGDGRRIYVWLLIGDTLNSFDKTSLRIYFKDVDGVECECQPHE